VHAERCTHFQNNGADGFFGVSYANVKKAQEVKYDAVSGLIGVPKACKDLSLETISTNGCISSSSVSCSDITDTWFCA